MQTYESVECVYFGLVCDADRMAIVKVVAQESQHNIQISEHQICNKPQKTALTLSKYAEVALEI